jgi:hypothetical protein
VSTASDLLEGDGLHARTEMRAGGAWTNACRDSRNRQDWVALMRSKLGVEDGRGVVSVPYAMPVELLCVGAFIGVDFFSQALRWRTTWARKQCFHKPTTSLHGEKICM